MKISIISDIHVHPDKSQGLDILKQFCRNSKVMSSDLVVLLGDIFDLMVYDFSEYEKLYRSALIEIQNLIDTGVKVVFVEGNHDFCLQYFFKNIFPDKNFYYFKNGFNLNTGDQLISFFHGDTIEIENNFYRFYRTIIKSSLVRSFYQTVVGFDRVWAIGSYFLNKSHDRHRKYSENFNSEEVREKFRKSADKFFETSKSDILICGHSHLKDNYVKNQKSYLNNGFAQFEKTFIYIDEFDCSFHLL